MTFSRVLYYGTNSCWWRKKAEFIIPSIMQGTKIPTVLSPWWQVFDAGIVEMLISVMQFSYFNIRWAGLVVFFWECFCPESYMYILYFRFPWMLKVKMSGQNVLQWLVFDCHSVTILVFLQPLDNLLVSTGQKINLCLL